MIRGVTRDDYQGILSLLKQLWPDKTLNEDRTRLVFEHGLQQDIYLCAEIGGEVVGFCSIVIKHSLWQEGKIAYVSELVVDEKVRGNKIGTALLERAMELSEESGCKRIELDSAFHRQKAHEFYSSMGFEKRAYLFSKTLESEGGK